jgi:FlaA1/EpsC-like NDP-sugar epimerase
MTRFNISLKEGVDMVMWAIENALGGEIFVPKIPSYRIMDVAKAIGPDCENPILGLRPGEKIHEEMITTSDSFNTLDLGTYFAILSGSDRKTKERYLSRPGVRMVSDGFCYNSGTNTDFLSINELRALIKQHVDQNFSF